MTISPVKTPETPYPMNMSAIDALYCLDAAEACLDAIAMEYTVQGSMSTPLVTLATSNLHVVGTYLKALSLKEDEDVLPF